MSNTNFGMTCAKCGRTGLSSVTYVGGLPTCGYCCAAAGILPGNAPVAHVPCRCGAFSFDPASFPRYEEIGGAIHRHGLHSCGWFDPRVVPAPSVPPPPSPVEGERTPAPLDALLFAFSRAYVDYERLWLFGAVPNPDTIAAAVARVPKAEKAIREAFASERAARKQTETIARAVREAGHALVADALRERDEATKRAEKAESEARGLRGALEEILAMGRDREAFVLLGPRAFARAEQIASAALEKKP